MIRKHRAAKKAQASLDYLFTYGWAIMALLAILGVLFYFDVFNVKTFIPERCDFGGQLECTDHLLRTETLSLSFKNNFRKEITIDNIEPGPQGNIEIIEFGESIKISPGQEGIAEVVIKSEFRQGSKEEISLVVTFHRSEDFNGPDHTITGSIIAKVQ